MDQTDAATPGNHSHIHRLDSADDGSPDYLFKTPVRGRSYGLVDHISDTLHLYPIHPGELQDGFYGRRLGEGLPE